MRKRTPTTQPILELVPLSELAGALGISSAAGLVPEDAIVRNWRGDPAVPSDIAGALVAAKREERATRARLAAEREELALENADERELVRQRAYREAYDLAFERAKEAFRASGVTMSPQSIEIAAKSDTRVRQAAAEAAARAVAEYDAKAGR